MVYTVLQVLTSTAKMEIIHFSETMVLFYKNMWYHNSDDHNMHLCTWAYFPKIHFNDTVKHYPQVKSVTYVTEAQL